MVNIDTKTFLDGLQTFGWKLGLDNIKNLLAAIGNPQRSFTGIHIAGTNGKGSTAAMLESIFISAGFKTGLYTSPHLVHVEERIRVDQKPIGQDQLEALIAELRPHIERLQNTYFETLTAAAFGHFKNQRVEVAIVEVGLGGRLDATNVFVPELSLITSISFDHAEHLGTTLGAIAREKAGILKPKVPCIIQSRNPEVVDAVREVSEKTPSPLYLLYDIVRVRNHEYGTAGETFDVDIDGRTIQSLRLNLIGQHQVMNAALAIAACWVLKSGRLAVAEEFIRQGLMGVKWPARLQVVAENPTVVIDVAHNPESIESVLAALNTRFAYDRLLIVIGLLADKDVDRIIKVISVAADKVVAVTPDSGRALPASELCDRFGRYGKAVMAKSDVISALAFLRSDAGQDDIICVLGSHYLLGDFLTDYRSKRD